MFGDREQLTYKQLIEAVTQGIQPLRKDIDDLRFKIDEVQRTAVSQAMLADYALKSVAEAQHKAFDERIKALENDDLQQRSFEANKNLQYMYITISIAVGVITLLLGAILSHVVFH